LDPAFSQCADGKQQSPIDISIEKLPAPTHVFSFDYPAATLSIIDNGTTPVQIGKQYLIIAGGHSVQLNVPADRQINEKLILNGKTYRLLQFHFHTPSETKLDHVAAPAEIHFVHQGDDGALAVVAVFVKVGASNPVLKKIVDNIPSEEGKELKIDQPLKIASLLSGKNGGYQFDGSLTTPPCTEGLTWLVLIDPITATPAQIMKLRKAANGANARPVQPINKRSVSTAVEKVK